MMHYKKGKNVEEELTRDQIPIECLPNDFLWMHVKGGTKISNVVEYAEKALKSGEHRNIVWSGTEGGVVKTVSCAEILKRKYDLHQITRVCYRKIEEYWEPQKKELEEIVVNRKVPCIHILLSLDEIDSNIPGYQHSKVKTKFYEETSSRSNDEPSSSKTYKFSKGKRTLSTQKPCEKIDSFLGM